MASSPSFSSSSSPSATSAAPASSYYWCYSCDPFVHAAPHEDSIVACPDYGGVILEEMAAAASDRSPFNPVIVPHRSPAAVAAGDDDGAGSGLRPLPETMSDFLMGYAFERLLD
uniref:RING-type E3 ubiquitin transferase n=1 Tax=Oryza rufipogon TaxID=4529 RepID=A0A0E0QVX9_ORYRU